MYIAMNSITILILFLIVVIFCLLIIGDSEYDADNLEGFDLKLWSDHVADHLDRPNRRTRYIFWTGGFDSTFRICQMLADESARYPIQPLYIIDDKVDGPNGGRRNRAKEIRTMNFLRKELRKAFPFSYHRLKETLYIDNVDHSYQREHFDSCMSKLIGSGCASRMHTQYRVMAIHTLKNGIVAEVGTEGRNEGAVIKHILPYLKGGYSLKREPREYRIFKNIRWPLSLYKKSDMLDEAKRDGYAPLLKKTFSCWFPDGDTPCGKCKMCKERLKNI
jgi:Queuosine biosynthesis protein QueC